MYICMCVLGGGGDIDVHFLNYLYSLTVGFDYSFSVSFDAAVLPSCQ